MQGFARLVSMTGQTVDETRGIPLDASECPYVSAYVTGTGTINSGKISFEEADWNPTGEVPYAGTWSTFSSSYDVTASNLSGGKTQAVHFPVASYHFIRPFIETAIGGGGSVSVVLVGHGGM